MTHCHVVLSCVMGLEPLYFLTGSTSSLKSFFCLFSLAVSEKKLLQNRAGSSTSQSKHNSWSESLSSAIRFIPGRSTKEMSCKSEVNFALCLFWVCLFWSAFSTALESFSGFGRLLNVSVD